MTIIIYIPSSHGDDWCRFALSSFKDIFQFFFVFHSNFPLSSHLLSIAVVHSSALSPQPRHNFWHCSVLFIIICNRRSSLSLSLSLSQEIKKVFLSRSTIAIDYYRSNTRVASKDLFLLFPFSQFSRTVHDNIDVVRCWSRIVFNDFLCGQGFVRYEVNITFNRTVQAWSVGSVTILSSIGQGFASVGQGFASCIRCHGFVSFLHQNI